MQNAELKSGIRIRFLHSTFIILYYYLDKKKIEFL